jgi:exodeoxyribonuclease VII small subunit
MVEATETFKQHYDNLRTIAEKMRSQQEPDIDQLIPMVDSALSSYKVCKERLDAVKTLLDERFGAEDSPA